METCDVLIVGGGPAGSSCAWKLRQHGMSVVVIDKAPFPRDKICAGWITPAVVQALQLDTGGYAEGRVLQPITAIRTGLIRGGELETRYPATISFGIRRCEFDHYLLQRSAARLRLGETLKSLEKRGSLWTVNDAIAAPLLIGAGGHFCPVARFLGAKLGAAEDAVAAKEIEFAMDAEQAAGCRVRADTPEIYFCRDLKGYGWCFRKGNYLNIGLGREGHQGLARTSRGFLRFSKAAWQNSPATSRTSFTGMPIWCADIPGASCSMRASCSSATPPAWLTRKAEKGYGRRSSRV